MRFNFLKTKHTPIKYLITLKYRTYNNNDSKQLNLP